jgi:hypothetical protein
MGVKGLEISITDNFMQIASGFQKLNTYHLVNGARRAINRTLTSVRVEAIGLIKEKINIKSTTLKDRHIQLRKASGGSLQSLQGSLLFSNDPIPMLEFVKGSKEPIVQKGLAVKQRSKVKVEITPGKRFVLHKAFIQRVHSVQVFKRGPSGRFHKQSVPSVGFMLLNRGVGEQIRARAINTFAETLQHEYEVRLEGLVKEMSREDIASKGGYRPR